MKLWKYMCLSLILTLGAWSSEATSRTLQDASMYGRYEQWLIRYGCVYNDINEKETPFKIFKESVAFIESSNKDTNKPYKVSISLQTLQMKSSKPQEMDSTDMSAPRRQLLSSMKM
ncbi:hypothetical protein DVH24_006138 [Malus domestica]|uniref:Cathepsin propeptide inhibitor domain-containing protein n=1 Tax=Malus domestica TaxID=3750 RepID=A0A498J0Y8_MALDO|nr:hypothetical protein DVH24_006138 [Malus domestica]